MKLYAHRGYSARYPENTMLAFIKAYEAGADGIECDVQLTLDGQVVVCHDERLDRTANASGWLRDYKYADLRCLRFDRLHNQADALDLVRIPHLSELLAWAAPLDLTLNIELKTGLFPYPGLVEAVIDLVEAYQMQERVIISSFNHQSILKLKDLAPDLACAFLQEDYLDNPGAYCAARGVGYYHPDYKLLDPATVNNLHDHGIMINAWTVDDRKIYKKFKEWELAGLITNDSHYLESAPVLASY
ncbi:glycerophosphodiester phosphodiesterase [Aerococcus loyolae]|uniref:glycerophosphodiester phosphodiesterase n=1 Tax=Aerococcus TaxID=1375 RepID=UPI0008A3D305|nr:MULTISPECIES: glycerophosphodiester phosphodiesterase [Aerococcus]MCY3067687.1 glycerophosphodiester phosphodiesterase [Aerococcus mictus]MCY3080412.1 glycerophosphodiester phosphodiesterase [Aerococcus mictus]MDK7910498.1 glycerophosphodiester phosphodiesterase [Aerococcus urinae]MDK8610230.1 glycerophosphodiester phosphodiesterase [Aerococcus urinae]MDL5182895.1 glycerophosphodiester phosphodiesterase [Aerococcus loyolae]